MKKELFLVGTRPDVIKMAPILLEMDPSEYILVHTGQHKELAKEALDVFGLTPTYDMGLMRAGQHLTDFFFRTFLHLSALIEHDEHEIARIWVQGDTSTALAGAFVGNFLKIPVVHVEAGLRSWDKHNPWPEETFRVIIDDIADILLTPTMEAMKNLEGRQFDQSTKFMTGNTVVDALEIIKNKLPSKSPCDVPYVLATVHRRESFGPQIREIFGALKELSKEIKVILPAHPNPNVREALNEVGLEFVEPFTYNSFLHHLKFCEYVVTDSGGVQEEAPSFGKKTIVLRKKTERPEAVNSGLSILVDPLTKENILATIKDFTSRPAEFRNNPFGDGKAAKRIVGFIKQL